MARRRTRLIRVDEELAELLKELSEKREEPITITSKELAKFLKKVMKELDWDDWDFRI